MAITRAFVGEGARVIAGSRRTSVDLKELANQGFVTPVEVDLADAVGPGRLVEAAGDRIDILVNNVGIAPPRPGGFLAVTDEQWTATWNLNVMAAVRATRAALPVMLAGGGGAIVNIGSVNARLPDPLVIDYSAAKAALVNLAKALSKESEDGAFGSTPLTPAGEHRSVARRGRGSGHGRRHPRHRVG